MNQNTKTEQKIFKATWGTGYYEPGEKIISLEDITQANGWDEDNIEAINQMEVGQLLDCSCIGGELHVMRIA